MTDVSREGAKTNTVCGFAMHFQNRSMTINSSVFSLSLRLSVFPLLFLPPLLISVVVLYTQGVESKQWREVRDQQDSTACLFSMTGCFLFTTPLSPPLLLLKVNILCQSFAID